MEPAPPAKCPRCRNVPLGDEPLIRHCGRCKGSWIAEETLHERVAEARETHPGLTWHMEARAALMCAICREPMETLVVCDTPVDRCTRHGIWFDANELAHVLAPVAVVVPVTAVPTQESFASELAGEGVALAVDVALETPAAIEAGSSIVETGGGVFEVVIDGVGVVASAVVDAIAGIFSSILD